MFAERLRRYAVQAQIVVCACACGCHTRQQITHHPHDPPRIAEVANNGSKTSITLTFETTGEGKSMIRIANIQSDGVETVALEQAAEQPVGAEQQIMVEPTPQLGTPGEIEPLPLDLATAWRLAGANNRQIEFAQLRLAEAQAVYRGAEVLWLPTITWGPGYRKHDGRIQATEGDIVEASRNSTYIGTAPNQVLGGPISTINLTDALYEPLAACQLVHAEQAALSTTVNNSLLVVGLAYIDLVQAQARVVIVEEIIQRAADLAELTKQFAVQGQGLESDAARARDELTRRRFDLVRAQEEVLTRSVTLANLLRLDPAVTLQTADRNVVAFELVPGEHDLVALLDQSRQSRPEIQQQAALVQTNATRLEQERMRPYIPTLFTDFSAGGFGGGEGSHFSNYSDRTDFTIMAVWELRNFGLGNRALQQQRCAQLNQSQSTFHQIEEQVLAEVTSAYHQVNQRRLQIVAAERNVLAASESLKLNMERIRGAAGLPIEALQAIQSLARARSSYLLAVSDYNRAQLLLLRAIGRPIEFSDAEPLPEGPMEL